MRLSEVVSINHACVVLMLEGSYERAVGLFRDSIRGLLDHVREVCDVEDEVSGDYRQDFKLDAVPLQEKTTLIEDPSPFEVYAKAFLIRTIGGEESREANAMAASIFLYNLALSHHMLAIRSANQGRNFYVAQKLYALSHGILGANNLLYDRKSCMLVRLAILNNKGHIHSLVFETDQTQVCVLALQELLLESEFSETEYGECAPFYFNVMLVRGARNVRTAAAA